MNSCGAIDLQKSSSSICSQDLLIARDPANLTMSEDFVGGSVGEIWWCVGG